MPGPANPKKKRRSKKKAVAQRPAQPPPTPPATHSSPTSLSSPSPLQLLTPPTLEPCSVQCYTTGNEEQEHELESLLPEKPFIYDPGNGPRVRDTRAFLASKFFAQPPAWNVPLCAEFAQDEVLEMIQTVLPEELALILWYNKSRATSRVCPACQRLYRLGDNLPEHMSLETESYPQTPNPRLLREQEISGLCSPVCFILAAFNYPGAIQSAWGRMGDEMNEDSWVLLNGPGDGTTHSDLSQGLGMVVKMTRLYDLGLAQLCFSDEDWDNIELPDTNQKPSPVLSAIQT